MKVKINPIPSDEFINEEAPKDIVRAFRASMFEQREQLAETMTYQQETTMMSLVRTGKLEELKELLHTFANKEVHIGGMSKDPKRQAQYSLISGITLVTRSAIEGGLSEVEAYNLSDVYIQKADLLTKAEDIYALFYVACCDFTKRVQQSGSGRKVYSYPISICIEYINSHLHYPITLNDLAARCRLTPQYLSSLFKKETGRTPTRYILDEKLETAKHMLLYSEYTLAEIANYLAFCSHSNFTEHFRKKYGVTPREFRNSKL